MQHVVLQGQAGGHWRQDLPSLGQMSPNHLPGKLWPHPKMAWPCKNPPFEPGVKIPKSAHFDPFRA